MNRRHTSRRFGFTLVELLVVIGIIAVLVGILLPALNKARAQSNSVKCLANLRSIGQALFIYAVGNKGSLPPGYYKEQGKPETETDWSVVMMAACWKKGGGTYATVADTDSSQYRQVFACPASNVDNSGAVRVLQYASNPRLMPQTGDITVYYDRWFSPSYNPATSVMARPYLLNSIKRSADIAVIFDAAQDLRQKGNCWPVANNLDQSGYYAKYTVGWRQWNYLVDDGSINLSAPINASNADYPPNGSNAYDMRYRHIKNDTANALFCDGHADSFHLKFGSNTDAHVANFYTTVPKYR